MDTKPYEPEDWEKKIESLRLLSEHLGSQILILSPDGWEKSMAMTKLEEMAMWAIKSIVLSSKPEELNGAATGIKEEPK